jgi:phosphoribosylamine--glycine ligase
VKLLIVGDGGREHALLWKLRRDAPFAEIFFSGRNAGMEKLARSVDLSATDVPGLGELAERHAMDLTVVGPEAALAAGIVDHFRDRGLRIFGPTRLAAEVESSKAFAKAFMRRHAIPTAEFHCFTDYAAAAAFLAKGEGPIVVKASGLLGGKGAVVCKSRAEARDVAAAMLRDGSYSEAGREVVIEELLRGREVSVIALTDGQAFRLLLPARDHKRLLDGDEGPNTGGMGAIAPVEEFSTSELEEIGERIVTPALRGLAAEGRPFQGALYAGLMLTEAGPSVIEFNARFGDPETQAVLPLLDSSLLDLLVVCAQPSSTAYRVSLAELVPRWRAGAACCVVVASAGYPGAYDRGAPIDLGDDQPDRRGRGRAVQTDGSTPTDMTDDAGELEAIVFHAGTERADSRLVTSGGRVLGVTGIGADLEQARRAAYQRLDRISFAGMRYRRDIGVAAEIPLLEGSSSA